MALKDRYKDGGRYFTQVTVPLTKEEVERLDRVCQVTRRSRADVVRILLDRMTTTPVQFMDVSLAGAVSLGAGDEGGTAA
jgi:Ribbon-helix-helix protein, copG family